MKGVFDVTFQSALDVFNYGLVLIYGLFLSVSIAGGCTEKRDKKLVALLCPVFLVLQSLFALTLGTDKTMQLYPLIRPPATGADTDAGAEKAAGRGCGQHLHGLSVLPAAALGQERRGSPDRQHAGRRHCVHRPAGGGSLAVRALSGEGVLCHHDRCTPMRCTPTC